MQGKLIEGRIAEHSVVSSDTRVSCAPSTSSAWLDERARTVTLGGSRAATFKSAAQPGPAEFGRFRLTSLEQKIGDKRNKAGDLLDKMID